MRKSIKLLAVALSVILLVATLATVISAIPAYEAPKGLTNLYSGNCEGANPSGFNATNGFTMSNVSYNENGVAHITNAPNGTMVTHTGRQIGTLCSLYKFIGDGEFTTFDFDLTADKYTNGTDIITPAAYSALSEAEKASYTPSYTYTRFYLEIPRLDTYGNECSLYIKQINGVWSLCNYANTAVPLSTTAGVWSHVTYVIDVDADVSYIEGGVKNTVSYTEYGKIADKSGHSEATVTYSCAIHIYVDGEYGFQLGGGVNNATCSYDKYVYNDDKSTTKNGAYFKYIQFQAGLYSSTRVNNPTSMMFDNVTLNKYPDGYNGDLANALATYGSLKYCDDTIFNVNYPYPAGTMDSASIINPDGSQESYYVYEAALNAVSEYCILSLNKDADIAFKPEFPFYVQTNGYKFTLAYDSTYLMEETGEAGLYLLREASPEDYGTVIFDEGGRLEASVSVIGGITPQYPAELGVIQVGSSMKLVTGWSTSKNAVHAEEIPAAVAGETIKLYPVYTNLAFAVTDINGKVVKGYADKLDFINATKTVAPGCTIVLYTDIDLNEFGLAPSAVPFTVTGELTIDLNGHMISRVFADSASNKPSMFTASASAKKLEIYSSVPGGALVETIKYSSFTGGGPLITNSSNAKIILGDGSDNLNVSCAMLLHNTSGTANMTINGGTYLVTYKESDGLFLIRGGNCNLTAKNATIGTYSDAVSIFSAKAAPVFNADIDNCLLIGGRFMYGFGADNKSVFNITNSDIVLTTSNDYKPQGVVVYLGDNVRYNKSYSTFAIANNCTAIETSDKLDVTYSWYRPINFITVDGKVVVDPECLAAPTEVKASYTMITTVYSNSRFGKIEWCDPSGNVVAETLGFPGTVATFDGDTSSFIGAQVTPYTAKSFSGWKNLAGTDDLTVLGGVTNRFTAVCEGDAVPYVRPSCNVATSTSFIVYFYLPADDSVTLNYVMVNGENVVDTNRMQKVKIGGVNYYRIATTPGACETETYNYVVKFTVDGASKTQSFDVSLESYFESVLSSSAYSLVEKQLIATALNYCNQVYNYVNGATYDPYDALLETYSGYVTSVTNSQIRADAELDMSAVKDTIKGALFSIGNGYKPMFGFIVADGVESVTFTNVTNKDGSTVTYTVTAGYGHESDILASGANIPAYDIRETITVIVGEETGTFNLAAYIVYLQSLKQTKENLAAINLCKALYAYSAASLAYKLS